VSIDGETVFEGSIRPAGARADRPAYVFQEFALAPGEHRLEIRFEPDVESARVSPTLDERIDLAPREILLVTRESETGRLSLHRGAR
jgi:hypothetical protein